MISLRSISNARLPSETDSLTSDRHEVDRFTSIRVAQRLNTSLETGCADLNRVDLASIARRYLRARRSRETAFQPCLFSDPAWDIMLDLFACRLEERKFCVSDASAVANVPATTALRWLARLESEGLIERRPDMRDARRSYVALDNSAVDAIETWLRAAFNYSAASTE